MKINPCWRFSTQFSYDSR